MAAKPEGIAAAKNKTFRSFSYCGRNSDSYPFNMDRWPCV